ncbi:MAG: prenyltransferase/squalene oxidase repeat-containing protein, partial [Fervidobacterium sp.]
MVSFIFSTFSVITPQAKSQQEAFSTQRAIEWIRSLQKPDGYFDDSCATPPYSYSISKTFWAIITLNILNSRPNNVQSCVNWIASLQRDDGGFYSPDPYGLPYVVEATYMSIISLLTLGSGVPNRQKVIDFLLSTSHSGGWYLDGNTLWATFDVIMAIGKLGVDIPNKQEAINYILSFRKSDGGFGHDLHFASSSIWGTFMAVLSLEALGVDPPNKQACVDYIYSLQMADGSFRGDPDLEGYYGVEPTFYAVSVLTALEVNIPNKDKCIKYLLSCQTSEGGFRFGYGFLFDKPCLAATYYAISSLSLLGAILPYSGYLSNLNAWYENSTQRMFYNWTVNVESGTGRWTTKFSLYYTTSEYWKDFQSVPATWNITTVEIIPPGLSYQWKVELYDPEGSLADTMWGQASSTVDTSPPSVTVLAPNGGESLTVGSTFRIRW